MTSGLTTSRRAASAPYMPTLASWTDRVWFVGLHAVMFALLLTASTAHATSRVKDVARQRRRRL